MMIEAVKLSLKVLPDIVGFPLLRSMSARTQRPPARPSQEDALARAVRFSYGRDGKNAAWSWGAGPLVILVHGWSGRAAQLGPLALSLSQQGFRAVAIDVTGHGESGGKTTDWIRFFRDIEEITRELAQPVHAYVGHSAGALSLMASRRRGSIEAARYVSLCSPTYPFPPLEFIQRLLAPSLSVMASYEQYLAQQFGCSWEELCQGWSFRGCGADLLAVYATDDKVVPHSEGERVLELAPGARVVKIPAYGHTKILAAPELADVVADFLR